jgi:hypothetical protein
MAGARNAVIQSRPAGAISASSRACVIIPAVADHHHVLEREAGLDLVDLDGERARISGGVMPIFSGRWRFSADPVAGRLGARGLGRRGESAATVRGLAAAAARGEGRPPVQNRISAKTIGLNLWSPTGRRHRLIAAL